MAGQGGLDADAMWAELKKADSSKIIDASHIPTSVLDGRWVTLSTNQTITGQKTFTQNILFSNNITGIRNTAGNLVFGVGNENIFCILNDYVGPVEAKNNQLVLGNDVGYWKKVTAGQYISKVATGVSPLIVSSNTLVNNLNSNYLEGYNNLGFIHSNYSASTGGTAYVSGDTHIMLVAEINIDTMYSTYVILLSNEFWGHQHYSALQLHIACTNNDNSGNKSPRCSVHVMSLVGSHARGVRYKIENNKAYIFIEVYGGNSYGRWASTILQNYDSITTNNANTTGNIKLKFAFNQANSGLTAASYDNYINAASLVASRTLWGQPFNGTANVSGDMTGVGSITMSGDLKIGNSTSPNTIYFYGTTGDGPGTHNHTFIAERLWGGTESSELVLFKGNDIGSGNEAVNVSNAGPDRIRHIAAAHLFQTYTSPLAGSVEDVCTSSALKSLFGIAANRVTSYVPFMSTVASGTAPFIVVSNTVVGNLNADMVDGLHLSDFDGRYVKKAGDTMTGDLTMNNTKGFNIGWSTRVVKTSSVWIHGGSDTASSTDANLRFGSWQGIGWYPTISGQTVAQGKNAMWLNVRTGALNVAGGIKESTICIGRVNSAGNYDAAYNGEINRYDHHLYLQHHSGKYLIMCTGGGLAGIGTNSPGEKLHVAGNTRTDGYFKSTVGTGTAPYQCSSTTLNTNLNADLLDGQHGAYYQNRMYDGFVAQYQAYDYIEFLRFVIPTGQTQLRAYVIFDLCRVERGGDMNGRAVLRIRRGGDNNAGYIFYVTNFGRSWLPELRCTTDDGITWRVWMKCVKDSYDPYIAIKIVEQYPYGCVTTQNTGTTGTPSGSKYTVVAGIAGLSNAANIWTNARMFYIQDHNASHTGAGISVNGSSNVYLKLPNSIQCSDWFRSTGHSGWYHQDYGGGIYMQDSTYVRVYGGKRFYVGNTENTNFSTNTAISTDGGIYAKNNITSNANIMANGTVTAKSSSSDRRLKRNICDFSASDIIRKLHPKTFYWNETAKRLSPALNHDKLNYGLIAQDVESMPELPLFASNIFGDYLILQYEKFIPILIQGVKEVDDEVTKLKREVARLNKRVKELEKSLCA